MGASPGRPCLERPRRTSPGRPHCQDSRGAAAWGSLGTGQPLTTERRRIRALPRCSRQLLGLRTELGRHPLSLILLDEPWDGLDRDGVRWLNATLEAKRDRGAGIVLSTRRLEELAGLCDKYLFLTPAAPFLFRAQDIEEDGRITPARLHEVFDMVRHEPTATIAWPRRACLRTSPLKPGPMSLP